MQLSEVVAGMGRVRVRPTPVEVTFSSLGCQAMVSLARFSMKHYFRKEEAPWKTKDLISKEVQK